VQRITRNCTIAGLALALAVGGALLHRATVGARDAEPAAPLALPAPASRVADNATTLAVLPARALPPPTIPQTLDENSLMVELRRVKESDPELALALARDGNERFPASPDAAERATISIYALTALGRSSEGRGLAEDMVNRYPDSKWVREVEQFTGAHRHRNIRTNDAGQLEYY
jgi:hypothetical protein